MWLILFPPLVLWGVLEVVVVLILVLALAHTKDNSLFLGGRSSRTPPSRP